MSPIFKPWKTIKSNLQRKINIPAVFVEKSFKIPKVILVLNQSPLPICIVIDEQKTFIRKSLEGEYVSCQSTDPDSLGYIELSESKTVSFQGKKQRNEGHHHLIIGDDSFEVRWLPHVLFRDLIKKGTIGLQKLTVLIAVFFCYALTLSAQTIEFSKQSLRATRGRDIEIRVQSSLGISLVPEHIKAKVSAPGQPEKILSTRQIDPLPLKLLFYVDATSECDRRDSLPIIKKVLSQILIKLTDQDQVALVLENSSGIAVTPFAPKDEKPFDVATISCTDQSYVRNPFSVIDQSWEQLNAGQYFEKSSEHDTTKVLLFSGGSFMADSHNRLLALKNHLSIFSVIYSPLKYQRVLSQVRAEEDKDPFAKMVEVAELLHPTQLTAFFSHIKRENRVFLKNSLPFSIYQSGSSPVSLSVFTENESKTFEATMLFDKASHFTLRSSIFLGFLLIIICAVLFVGFRFFYRRYKPPLCPITGRVISRTWNTSLFSLDSNTPLLYIETKNQGQWRYDRCFALLEKKVLVGRSFLADLNISTAKLEPFVLSIEKKSFLIWQVASHSEKVFLNEQRVSGPTNLRCCDLLTFGDVRMFFLTNNKGVMK